MPVPRWTLSLGWPTSAIAREDAATLADLGL
jgi:hypothetical protein